MEVKIDDFIRINFNMYANGVLVQTTDEKKGKLANLQVIEYKPFSLIVGKGFLLSALDDDIVKNKSETENVLELKPERAFGKKSKEMLKIFPKSVFYEQKLKIVPGVTYDFNGMYGTVKAITGGRVMVDFNHPLAGKDIKVVYKIVEKIEDISEKIKIVLKDVLKIPLGLFEVQCKEKNVFIKVPEQFKTLDRELLKSLQELIPEIKDYSLKFEVFKK